MSGLCLCKTSCRTVLRIFLGPHPDRLMIAHCSLIEVGKWSSPWGMWWGLEDTCRIINSWVPQECTMCPGAVDQGYECSLIYGNPKHFPGTPAVIDGYG